MTVTEIAGAILWGGAAAAVFLRLLQRDLLRIAVTTGRGRFLGVLLRVLSTAVALVLVGVLHRGLIPMALLGFALARHVLLWRTGVCRGH